jgi:mannose-6-phosphate isomerase-like protein (cupin superfamily)
MTHPPSYVIEQLDELPPRDCPCGSTRRGFAGRADTPVSIHWVEISAEARTHYHKRLTEIYIVIEGEGHLELDGQHVPVKPLTSVLIRPGCRHRAVGRLKVINVVLPAFDPADEWFD